MLLPTDWGRSFHTCFLMGLSDRLLLHQGRCQEVRRIMHKLTRKLWDSSMVSVNFMHTCMVGNLLGQRREFQLLRLHDYRGGPSYWGHITMILSLGQQWNMGMRMPSHICLCRKMGESTPLKLGCVTSDRLRCFRSLLRRSREPLDGILSSARCFHIVSEAGQFMSPRLFSPTVRRWQSSLWKMGVYCGEGML